MFVRLPVCPFVRLSVTDISATVRLIGVKFNTIVESSAPDRSPDMSSPLLVAISLRSPNGGQNWLFGQFVFGVTLSLCHKQDSLMRGMAEFVYNWRRMSTRAISYIFAQKSDFLKLQSV